MLNLVALSAALLLGVAIILFVQKRLRRKYQVPRRAMGAKPKNYRRQTKSYRRETKSYAAAGIRADLRACAAVQEFYGKRFLAEEAPMLPVVGCTVRLCPCRYQHFADRREDEDRRLRFGIRDTFRNVTGVERRRVERRHSPMLS